MALEREKATLIGARKNACLTNATRPDAFLVVSVSLIITVAPGLFVTTIKSRDGDDDDDDNRMD